MQPLTDFITIVSGLPRSGTSMMMRMLEVGGIPALTDHVRKADDDNPEGYYEFERAKRLKQDSSWLDEAPGKAVKLIYKLIPDLPAVESIKIIYMQRDLKEVLASQAAMLSRNGASASAVDDPRMIDLFSRELVSFEKLLEAKYRGRYITISHRKIINDPGAEIARIVDFLGVPLQTRAMIQVCNPSLHRQRG